MPLCRNL